MLAISVGVLLILGWTWKGVYVDALRIKKAGMTLEYSELQGQQKHLNNELITLRSFQRIDRLARTKLNMVYANRPPRVLPVSGLAQSNAKSQKTKKQNIALASKE